MNKLLTYQGAQPVYLGDIDFMQNAASAGFLMLAKAISGLGSDTMNAILQGVVITRVSSSQTHVSAGVVVLNGELLPVEEATINVSWRAPLYFHIDSVLSSERTFKDGQSHKCHDTRSAFINGVSTDGIALESVPRTSILLDNHVYEKDTVTGNVEDARLRIKNGIWFIEAELNIPQGASVIGGMTFSGISYEHMNSLEDISFALPVSLASPSVKEYLLSAAITKDASNNSVSIVFGTAADPFPEGLGYARALVPCF